MISTLHEEDIAEYASEAETIQEPQGVAYSQGANVGRTVPARFWNWLFKAITKRLHEIFLDTSMLHTELVNVLSFAGITPNASSENQLVQAAGVYALKGINARVQQHMFEHSKFIAPVLYTDDAQHSTLTYEDLGASSVLYVACIRTEDFGQPWFMMVGAPYNLGVMYSTDMIHWAKFVLNRRQYSYYDPALGCFYAFEDAYDSEAGTYHFEWYKRNTPLDAQSEELVAEVDIASTERMEVPIVATWKDVSDKYYTLVMAPNGNLYLAYDNALHDLGHVISPQQRVDNFQIQVIEAVTVDNTIYVGNIRIQTASSVSEWSITKAIPEASNIIKVVKLYSGALAFISMSTTRSKILLPDGTITDIPSSIILFSSDYQDTKFDFILAEKLIPDTAVTVSCFSYDGINFKQLPFRLRGHEIAKWGQFYVLYDSHLCTFYTTTHLSDNLSAFTLMAEYADFGYNNHLQQLAEDTARENLIVQNSSAIGIVNGLFEHLNLLEYNGAVLKAPNNVSLNISLAGVNDSWFYYRNSLFINARLAGSYVFKMQDNRVHDFTLYR